MDDKDLGILLNKESITLHRQWFTEMCQLLGINVIYRRCKPGKTWDGYGELSTAYEDPEIVSCIYNENVDQKTMRKLGWNVELNDSPTIISVPYDLEGIQVGCLFIIPSGIDGAEGRVFRVLRMSTIPIYPSSITCELGPVWKNKTASSEVHDFKSSNFNLLNELEDGD